MWRLEMLDKAKRVWRINVSLKREQYRDLEKAAERRGASASGMARQAIVEFLSLERSSGRLDSVCDHEE